MAQDLLMPSPAGMRSRNAAGRKGSRDAEAFLHGHFFFREG